MKISVITVVYNCEKTIADAIESVLAQDHPDVEYIVVDGASKDGTMEVVNRYRDRIDVIISEPDKGIYDAMNKGVDAATGDVIGILNADDFFMGDDILSSVAKFMTEKELDCMVGDLIIVAPDDLDKIRRLHGSKGFTLKRFEKGDMPPHPTFYAKRELFEKYGKYNIKYRIIADFDLLLRFMYIHKAKWAYLPKVMVKMRAGGLTKQGFMSKWNLNKEIYGCLKDHGIKTSMFKIMSKYFTKVFQLLDRPEK